MNGPYTFSRSSATASGAATRNVSNVVPLKARQSGIQSGPRMNCRYISERAAEFESTTENSDGSVTFGGYLLHWGDVANIKDFMGEYTEEFNRGALEKSFKERGPKGSRAIKLLRQHNREVAQAGKFTDLFEDDIGPGYEARTINTTTGRDTAEEIREGVMTAMSIGFDSMREEFDAEEIHFRVLEAKMYEASPVLWGAYETGSIDNFRALEMMPSLMERALRALEEGESETLPEALIGQLSALRARIGQVLDGAPVASRERNREAPVNSHADQEVLIRLRMAEALSKH